MNNQNGVSLIIVFLVMTVVIAIVLSIAGILFNEIKIIGSIGNSVSAFYAADTGVEKTLYFDRKEIHAGANRGFCTTCSACASTTGDCNVCTYHEIVPGGCGGQNCTDCQLDYQSAFANSGATYTVSARVTTDANPAISDLLIDSAGNYNSVLRKIESSSSTGGP